MNGYCDFCNKENAIDIKKFKSNNQIIYVCKRCLLEIWQKNTLPNNQTTLKKYGLEIKNGNKF